MSEDKHAPYRFFVDAKEYETEKADLSGLDIKTLAAVDGTYQLYLEEEGDTPDRAISDSETVTLKDRVKHFFAVPPATFG